MVKEGYTGAMFFLPTRPWFIRWIVALMVAATATVWLPSTDAVAAKVKSPPKSPEKVEAQARFEKGLKAYNLGNFPDAIVEFSKAYDLFPEPVFLFNIAQAHRQSGNTERALFFYRRYLASDPSAQNGAEVERRIHDLETALAAKKEAPGQPPAGPPATVVPPPASAPPALVNPQPTPVASSQGSAMGLTEDPSERPQPGRSLRLAGLSLGAVGVVGLVAGGYYATRVNALRTDAFSGPYDAGKLSSAKSAQTMERVSFVVGGAALATGAVLYFLGYQAAPGPATVAIAPLSVPGAAGAHLSGAF